MTWQAEFDSISKPINEIKGSIYLPYLPDYQTDTASNWSIQLFRPSFTYQKLGKKRFLRKFEHGYQLEGQGYINGRIKYQDTLSKRQVKEQLKSKDLHPELRGANPFIYYKYISPGLWILGGTGGILALFYVRSR
ncbi:MAG: hypothetical protein MRZ79_23755 [Bacteroidia bacterium]|nr:hypothetical protein [Bacteroidia bacterium]